MICKCAASWAAVYPLDTAKSRIQASSGAGESTRVLHQLARLYREHGLRGWYAGLSAGLLRAFLANGGGMAIYGVVLSTLAQRAEAPRTRSGARERDL